MVAGFSHRPSDSDSNLDPTQVHSFELKDWVDLACLSFPRHGTGNDDDGGADTLVAIDRARSSTIPDLCPPSCHCLFWSFQDFVFGEPGRLGLDGRAGTTCSPSQAGASSIVSLQSRQQPEQVRLVRYPESSCE